jgi:hypothetical protein
LFPADRKDALAPLDGFGARPDQIGARQVDQFGLIGKIQGKEASVAGLVL